MLPYLGGVFGNPSSAHALGRAARNALDEAREQLAADLGGTAREIVLTSGGTEANNLAVKGAAWTGKARGSRLVIGAVEHHAVGHTAEHLAKWGFEVAWAPVDEHGRVRSGRARGAPRRADDPRRRDARQQRGGHDPAGARDRGARPSAARDPSPRRRRAGGALPRRRRCRAGRGHRGHLGPQVRGAEGRRGALDPARDATARPAPRREPGAPSPRRHGERGGRGGDGDGLRAGLPGEAGDAGTPRGPARAAPGRLPRRGGRGADGSPDRPPPGPPVAARPAHRRRGRVRRPRPRGDRLLDGLGVCDRVARALARPDRDGRSRTSTRWARCA